MSKLSKEEIRKRLSRKHLCPVCGKTEFPKYLSHEICEFCGWQDDILDESDPDECTGANPFELSEYCKKYKNGWRMEGFDS